MYMYDIYIYMFIYICTHRKVFRLQLCNLSVDREIPFNNHFEHTSCDDQKVKNHLRTKLEEVRSNILCSSV